MCRILLPHQLWITLIGAAMLLGSAAASDDYPLRIEVSNQAHVALRDLIQARQITTAIFLETGISIEWTEALVSDGSDLAMDFSGHGASCRGAGDVAGIKLLLVRQTPPATLPDALGFALPCAKSGLAVTVFVDRCVGTILRNPGGFRGILGHVMAHEIGHVLLGTSTHAAAGIMSERWSVPEFCTIAAGHMKFTERQAKLMRERIPLRSADARLIGNMAPVEDRGFGATATNHAAPSGTVHR